VLPDPEPSIFSQQDSLLLAAAINDLPLARRLLARGAGADRPYVDSLNAGRRRAELPTNRLTLPDWTQVQEGETPLHLAVRRGYVELTDLLRHSPYQGQPAAKAVLCEALIYVPNQLAILERLLATGLPPDSAQCGSSPLAAIIAYNMAMRQQLAAARHPPTETRTMRQRRRFMMGEPGATRRRCTRYGPTR
jgi:hypothetical protein